MIKRFLLGTVIACLSVISLSANAVIINVSYTGTVDGFNTDFGFGTEIIFEGSYDTVDATGDTVTFQSSYLSIGGTTQAGVNASAIDTSPPDARAEFFIQWDSPPPNPDLSIVFDAINSTVGGLIITNINGNICFANPSFCKMFEYNYEDILGKNATKLFLTKK